MTILTWNGFQIEQSDKDGMVNLTQLAKANAVLIGHWNETDQSKKYIEAISVSTGKPISELYVSHKTYGTWAHPLIAIAFAQWISPDFHVWCNIHIKTLIETGSTELPQVKEPEPTRIADPTTLGANFYAWDDRNKGKTKWWLEKLTKQNKGKCMTMLRDDVSGLSLLDVYNAKTGDRVYTLFAFMENVSAVIEMRSMMEARLTAGAKLIVRT